MQESELPPAVQQKDVRIRALKGKNSEKNRLYLFLANAGAAAAVASYLGASEIARTLFWPKVTLVIFLIGVLVCGVILACLAAACSLSYKQHLQLSQRYYERQITWLEFQQEFRHHSFWTLAGDLAGAVAFLALFIGAATAAMPMAEARTTDEPPKPRSCG